MTETANRKRLLMIAAVMGIFMLTETLYMYRHYGASAFGIMAVTANLIMFVGLLTGFIGHYLCGWKTENVYLAFGIAMGLVFLIIFPIYVVPDEPVHLNTAYELSNRLMGVGTSPDGVYYRACDRTLPVTVKYTIGLFNEYYGHLFEPTGNTELILRNDGTVATMFYQYIPGALGITLGRLLNLNTLTTFLLGRLFTLACFVTLIYFAIKLLPVGKMVLMVVALTPMMLQQGMSYSYDWFLNSISILITVFTVRIMLAKKEGQPVRRAEYIVLAVLSVLLLPLKGKVYFAISLMPWILILMPEKPMSAKYKSILKKFAYTLIVLIAVFTVYRYFAGGQLLEEPENIISFAELQGYTPQFFINKPYELIFVLKQTFFQYGMSLFSSCIGDNFGWLEINLYTPVLYMLYAALFLTAVKNRDEKSYFTGKQKAWVLACSGIAICSVFGAMLLRYSPVGWAIMGVQGRYFIPTELAVLLAVRGNWITKYSKVDQYSLFIMIAAVNLTANLLIMYYS